MPAMNRQLLKNRSLSWKISLSTLIVLLVITLIFAILLTFYENSRRKDAIEQITQSLNDLTKQYSEQLGNEIFALQELATRQTLAEISRRRNILAVTTFDESGAEFISSANEPTGQISFAQISIYLNPETTFSSWNDKKVLEYLSPITAYGETVGYWLIVYDLTTLNHQTLEIIGLFVALIISLYLVLGLLLNKMLHRLVLEPVHALQSAMQQIEQSNSVESVAQPQNHTTLSFSSMVSSFDRHTEDLQVSNSAKDEIGSLAYTFRQMLISLKNAYTGIRTDPLTRMNNRLKLDEILSMGHNLATTQQVPLSVILIDIDNFKKINDSHGHLAGDDVLKQLACLLKDNLRQDDTPGRWGGEEFLIVLVNKNREQAAIVAEKLRLLIAKHNFAQVGRVTASFGVAQLGKGDSTGQLIKQADRSLYQAKAQGRNRVVVQ